MWMTHARHDNAMVPIDVGAIGDVGWWPARSGARNYGADATMLDGDGVSVAELIVDEVDVVDDKRRIFVKFHLDMWI